LRRADTEGGRMLLFDVGYEINKVSAFIFIETGSDVLLDFVLTMDLCLIKM
jgi:hypothetical protein